MRRIAFIITIIGIFTLLSILTFQKPVQVNSINEINNIEDNKEIIIKGNVTSQTQSTITLSNRIKVQCYSCPSYLNKEITLKAIVEKYNNKTYIKTLKVYKK